MREAGLRCQSSRKFRVTTTDSNHTPPVAENVLARDFTAEKPFQKCVSDITYIATLEMAVSGPTSTSGLIAHSDRGVQYASEHDQRTLTSQGIACRMSRRGDGWDNAPAESFFATLKKELVPHEVYETRTEARARLFEYIEVFDNRQRLHSSLGDLSPTDFEAAV